MSGWAEEAWLARRMAYEGAPVTFELLAMMSGLQERTVRSRAKRERWRAPEEAANVSDLERRLKLLSDRLVADLETTSAEGQRAGAYDKARIDAVAAMLRMVERIGETMRGPERAREEQTRSDEEMAAALERIDRRITELAEELAAQLGCAEPAEEAGAGD